MRIPGGRGSSQEGEGLAQGDFWMWKPRTTPPSCVSAWPRLKQSPTDRIVPGADLDFSRSRGQRREAGNRGSDDDLVIGVNCVTLH